MTQESPKFGLAGRTLKNVRALGPVMVIDFEGDTHLIFTPEEDAGTKKINMRATLATGRLPVGFSLLVPVLPVEAQIVLGRMVLTEGVMLRQFGPSLVVGFDESISMVIPLGGGPLSVEKDGVVLGPPKVRLT